MRNADFSLISASSYAGSQREHLPYVEACKDAVHTRNNTVVVNQAPDAQPSDYAAAVARTTVAKRAHKKVSYER